jgi:hypothetical protein
MASIEASLRKGQRDEDPAAYPAHLAYFECSSADRRFDS